MDLIADIALQEIALEGQSGVTLPNLWDLMAKRVGGYVHKEKVKKAVWGRLCLLDGEQIVVHKREVENGNVAWPRVERPFDVKWEALGPEYVVKASVKLRVRALGMDFGNAGDPVTSAELKKQTFRVLQLIGATRLDGMKQTALASKVQLDASACSLLLTYAESRNLISKYNAHNGKMVHIRRLTERKPWPLFYNGLNFIAGATSSLKRTQALRLLQQATPSLLQSQLAKNTTITMGKVITSITTTVLKDMSGVVHLIGMHRIRGLLRFQILGIVANRKDFVVQRDQNGHLLLVPASEANPDMIVGELDDEEDDALPPAETHCTLAPWRPFFNQFFTNIIESSPVGCLKNGTIIKNGKLTEALIPEVQSLPGIETSTTNIGKSNHQVLFAKSEFTNTVLSMQNGYSPAMDPMLFPSKAREVVVGSDKARRAVEQTFALPAASSSSQPSDRKYYLGGTYKSWAPGIGNCVTPTLQWKPAKPPLSQADSVSLTKQIEDTTDAANARMSHWVSLSSGKSVKIPKINTEGVKLDPSLGNLTTRYLKAAVLEKLMEKKIIGYHSVRDIVKEPKLFKRIINSHEKENSCERRVCTVQVLAMKKEVEFWCVVGFDGDSDIGKAFFEELNAYHVKYVAAQSVKISDEYVVDVVKKFTVPPDCAKDEILTLLYQLTQISSVQLNKLRETRPPAVKRFFDAKRNIHTFWIIKNGFITSKMLCIQSLHSYLHSQSSTSAFNVKDLIDGMTLRRFGKLVGIPFKVADIIDETEDMWDKRVMQQPEKLIEYIYGEGRSGTLLKHLKGCLNLMLHLGLLERVRGKVTHIFQDEYKLCSTADLKKVVINEELESLLRVKFRYNFTEESEVTEYWETLRAILCDHTIASSDLNLTVLGPSTRATYTWDGGLPIHQITEKKVNDFRTGRDAESFTPVDAHKLTLLTRLNFAQAVSCLTGKIRLLRTSVKTVHKTIGLHVVAKGKKRKPSTKKPKPPKKKVKREKPPKTEEDDEDDEPSDDELVDGHYTEVAKRPRWATADKLVTLLKLVIETGVGSSHHSVSSKGMYLLKTQNMAEVAEAMGWTEQKLKTRWRYILKKPELKLLTRYAMLARTYNEKCDFDINTSLESFMSESYNPCFKRGARLPAKHSDFTNTFSVIRAQTQEQRYHPFSKKAAHRPKLIAAIEALKLLNMCPESAYDIVSAQGLMEGFCESPDANCLQEALTLMTNSSSGNLLAKVKRAPGTRGRHFQLTQSSEECLHPRHYGLAHYQEAWGVADATGDKTSYTPHAVLSGGQVAHIVDEVAAGRLSLVPQEYAGLHEDENPLQVHRFRRATVAKLMLAFFKTATRAQKVYYIDNGIKCVPNAKKEMPIVAEVENDSDEPASKFDAAYSELWKMSTEPEADVKRPLVRTAHEVFGDRYFEDNQDYLVTQAEHTSTAEVFDSMEEMNFIIDEPEEECSTLEAPTWMKEAEPLPPVAVEGEHAIPLLVSQVTKSWLKREWNMPEGAPGIALEQLLSTPDALRLFMPFNDDVNPTFLRAVCAIIYKAVQIAGRSDRQDGLRLHDFKVIFQKPLAEAAPRAPVEVVSEAAAALALPVSNMLSATRCVVRMLQPEGDDLHMALALGETCMYPVQKMIAVRARKEYTANTIKPAGVMQVAALAVAAVVKVEMQGALHAGIVAGVLAIIHVGSGLDAFEGGSVTVVGRGMSHLGSNAKDILKGNVFDSSTAERRTRGVRYRKDYATLGNVDDDLESIARPLSALVTMHGTVNHAVMARVILAVYDYLVVYPGTAKDTLATAFPFINHDTLSELLVIMVAEGSVRSVACPVTTDVSPTSLFSDPQNVRCTACYYAIPGAVTGMRRVADNIQVS